MIFSNNWIGSPSTKPPKNVTVMAPTNPFRVISLIKGGRPGVRIRMPTGGCFNESLSSNTWPTEPDSLVQGSCLQAVGPFLAFVEDKHDLSKYCSVWANKWARTRHKAGEAWGRLLYQTRRKTSNPVLEASQSHEINKRGE